MHNYFENSEHLTIQDVKLMIRDCRDAYTEQLRSWAISQPVEAENARRCGDMERAEEIELSHRVTMRELARRSERERKVPEGAWLIGSKKY